MQNKNKKKICLVVSSLGKGGAERSAALLSKTLHHAGHKVTIVTILNTIDFDFDGNILNLGELKDRNDSLFGKARRFFRFRKFLIKEQFDFIIDSRTRVSVKKQKRIAKHLYRSTPVIYMVRSFELDPYLGKNKKEGNRFYSKAFKVVGVTQAIVRKVKTEYLIDNVICINNAVEMDYDIPEENIPVTSRNYILYYGRLNDEIKNISLLIQAYTESALPNQGIEFLIMGDGTDASKLRNLVHGKACSDMIRFLPYRPDPFPIVKHAMFTVLGSRYEGLPRSVIESLALGVPVISANYKGDPSEIITHSQNGLIVEGNSTEAFANAMNSFIFDDELYQRCRSNTRQSVAHLSIEHIAGEWDKLLT